MSTQTSHRLETQLLGRDVAVTLSGPWTAYWIRFLSFIMGWYFLHAGLDKIVNWPFDASWFVGGGLILLGAVVIGVIETQFGSPHAVTGEGQIVHETLVPLEVRSFIILAGLLVWLLYAVFKLTSAHPPGATTEPAPETAD
jgi:hypothetical protein